MTRGCPGHHDVKNGIVSIEGIVLGFVKEGKITKDESKEIIIQRGRIEWGCKKGEDNET